MIYLILKAALTGVIVVAISEISKRSSVVAAILASLPLTSILAFVWMYHDDGDAVKIRSLSYGIFWMVIPSLAFFLILPTLLKAGLQFYPALLASSLGTAAFYFAYAKTIGAFGVKL